MLQFLGVSPTLLPQHQGWDLVGAAKEDKNALGNYGCRIPPPSLQQMNLTRARTAPGWFLNTQLWNTSHAFVNPLFPRQARPQNSTLGLPAAQFMQCGLPHPLHHSGGTKANHRVEGVLGIRLTLCSLVVGQAGMGIEVLLPLNAATAVKEQSQQRQARTAEAMGGEEHTLMLRSVQSNLLDLCFSNYTGLPGITCLFPKFCVMRVCAWTVIDLQG